MTRSSTAGAPGFTEQRREALLDRLRTIQDPCSVAAGRPMDVVQMGLIGELQFEGDDVRISLVLTEPVCWFSRDILDFVRDAAERTPGVRKAEVYLDESTIWTPDRIQSLPPFLGRYPVVTGSGPALQEQK